MESAEALAGLCADLLDSGEAVDIYPLQGALLIALVHVAGLAVKNTSRFDFRRTAFIVNTDGGGVYHQAATDYNEAEKLGDMTRDDFRAIVSGPAIKRLHAQDDALEASRCRECAFSAACSRWPLMVEATNGPRCGVIHALIQKIVELLKEHGIAHDEAQALLDVVNSHASERKLAPV